MCPRRIACVRVFGIGLDSTYFKCRTILIHPLPKNLGDQLFNKFYSIRKVKHPDFIKWINSTEKPEREKTDSDAKTNLWWSIYSFAILAGFLTEHTELVNKWN